MHQIQPNYIYTVNTLGPHNCELSKSGISSTLLLFDCFENPICATVKVIILEFGEEFLAITIHNHRGDQWLFVSIKSKWEPLCCKVLNSAFLSPPF